jgi:endo-1,4-beta-xylanase
MLMNRWNVIGLLALAALSLAQTTAPATPPAPAATAPAPRAGRGAGQKIIPPKLDVPVAGITPIVLKLWPDKAPGQIENAPPEWDDGTGRIRGTTEPGILVYLPPEGKRNGVAIIACPGGSYEHLTKLVGADELVQTFCPQGVAVISLKYRLKPPSTDVAADALADGRRAVQLVRQHAKEWGIDPHKVGMVGWSAGGNLILNQATHPVQPPAGGDGDGVLAHSSRPDFVGLLSPWPNGKTIDAYPVPADAPPAFIGNAEDDRTAPVAFARAVGEAWKTAGANVEMDIVPTGGHGAFEIGTGSAKDWPEKFTPWLKDIGIWPK